MLSAADSGGSLFHSLKILGRNENCSDIGSGIVCTVGCDLNMDDLGVFKFTADYISVDQVVLYFTYVALSILHPSWRVSQVLLVYHDITISSFNIHDAIFFYLVHTDIDNSHVVYKAGESLCMVHFQPNVVSHRSRFEGLFFYCSLPPPPFKYSFCFTVGFLSTAFVLQLVFWFPQNKAHHHACNFISRHKFNFSLSNDFRVQFCKLSCCIVQH